MRQSSKRGRERRDKQRSKEDEVIEMKERERGTEREIDR